MSIQFHPAQGLRVPRFGLTAQGEEDRRITRPLSLTELEPPLATPRTAVGRISEPDRRALAGLFRYLIADSNRPFAYTLFGDKPVTAIELPQVEAAATTLQSLLKVWRQNAHLFPEAPLDFHVETLPPARPDQASYGEFALFNRPAALRTIEKHLALFRERQDDPSLNATALYRRMLDSSNFFKDVLKGDDLLMGLLYGFGLDNARAFVRFTELKEGQPVERVAQAAPEDAGKAYDPLGSYKKRYVANPEMAPSAGFKTTQEELDTLVNTFHVWPLPGSPDFESAMRHKPGTVPLPIFRSLTNSAEARQIQENYRRIRDQAQVIYDIKDNARFLEAALAPFAQPSRLETGLGPLIKPRDLERIG